MSAMKCTACGGVYQTIGADNVPYVHVCGPVTCVAIARAGVAGIVPLTKVQPGDVVQVQRGSAVVAVAVKDVQAGDVRIGDVLVERANKRDENVTRVDLVNGVKTPVLKSEGAGNTVAVNGGPAAPVLLDAL